MIFLTTGQRQPRASGFGSLPSVAAASEIKGLTRFEPFAIKWIRFLPSRRPGPGGKKEKPFEKARRGDASSAVPA